MKVVCAAPNCKYSSDDEDSSHVIFVSFPNDDTAAVWAHNCGRPDLMVKSTEELHLNYYICSDHIEDQYFLSRTNQIIITQGAIPTLFGLQMQPERLDPLKSSYSSSEVMNPLELGDCQGTFGDDNSEYQSTIYNGNTRAEGMENKEESHLNFDSINVNIEQFEDVNERSLNLCRICGNNPAEYVNIFDGREDGLTLEQKIRLHLPIIVESGDGLPQKICGECRGKIESSHALVITSLLNDMRLRKFLNLPNKYNYEEKYQVLISKLDLQSDERFLEGLAPGECDLPRSSGKSPPADKEKRLKYVLHSDLNNLILQSLQFQTDERAKTAPGSAVEEMIDGESEEMACPVDDEFQGECDGTEAVMTEGNPEGEEIELTDGMEGPVMVDPGPGRPSRRCGHCSQAFTSRKDMQAHLNEAHSDQGPLFQCGVCDKSYEKWSSLDVHEATHRQDKPYLCDLCGKSFKHSNNLRGHKRVHLDAARKKRHVCETCGSAFRSRFHLREHMNQHDGTKPYVCEQCGKAFSKRIQLRQHRLSHGINKYSCPICGMTFNRRGNMNTHFKRHSSSDGMYKCSVCDSKCKSMSDLKSHRKTHSLNDIIESMKRRSIDKTVWQCSTCSRVFSKLTHLSNHERIHKSDQPKVECDKCGKKLASKSSLRYHVKSMHTCERNHLCQFCGDAFVTREARLIHERIHTGERPYTCKLCNMEYRCSSNLSQHMKAHAEVRPFVCQYCSKSFTRRSALTIHERIHTGEKPFVCSLCQCRFAQKYDLVRHEKTHQSKEYPQLAQNFPDYPSNPQNNAGDGGITDAQYS